MATKVLVLGANGGIAQHVTGFLKKNKNIELTLFSRNTYGSKDEAPGATIINGDVLNSTDLDAAMKGQDIVYANLAGQIDKMAAAVVASMKTAGVKRLIFITSLGIYKEIPGKFGQWNEKMIGADLVRYRHAADIIEGSTLDYTIVRPSWLTDRNESEYETTQKGEPFTGTEVARKAVAAYVASIIENSDRDVRANVGVQKPGSQGDKPPFY